MYMNEMAVINTPPVKIYHFFENPGVMPNENLPVNSQQLNSSFNNNINDEELLKKKIRRQRNRHITKDLNAPPSYPMDSIDHREIILTGAVLKPSSITPPPLAVSDHSNMIYETSNLKSSPSLNINPQVIIPPVLPLKIPPPVTTQPTELTLNFSREELLQISSDDFEEHVRQISAIRPLSGSERNLIKRQRRLIKNRESAQASRQRKKDYVGDLEKKVGDLISNNAKLKEEFSSLTAENRQLKNEVEFLADLVGKVKVSEG